MQKDLIACGLVDNRRCEMTISGTVHRQCPYTARWELTFYEDAPGIACCTFHMDESIELHQQNMRAQHPARALHAVKMDPITTKNTISMVTTEKLDDGHTSWIA